MHIGIDLVPVKRIENNELLVSQVLTEAEIAHKSLQTLAGKIAAKEALVKVGLLKPGEWKTVVVLNDEDGRPVICNSSGEILTHIDLSISHTDELAIAVVVYDKKL